MSTTTPRLKLPELSAAQAQKHVTHNDALIQLDVLVDLYLLGTTNTPPGSPADGDAYLVGASPSGAWTGRANAIASCLDGSWNFYAPFNGLRAYRADLSRLFVYSGGSWVDWTTTLTIAGAPLASASIWVGNGSNAAAAVAVTGDVSLSNAGALTVSKIGGKAVTLGGALTLSGAFGFTGTLTGTTSVIFPTSGTLATLAGSETLTNKTLSAPAFSGIATGFRSMGITDSATNTALVIDAHNNIGTWGAPVTSGEPTISLNGGAFNLQSPVFTQGFFGYNTYRNTNWYWATTTAGWSGIRFYSGSIHFHGNASASPGAGTQITTMDSSDHLFVIDSTAFYPNNDNTQSAGKSGNRFSVVYAATGTINTSGGETKAAARALNEDELAVAMALSASVRVYQFCDAVAKKGEAARLHVGMIYEEVIAAFAAHGLDPLRYGIVCRDPAMKPGTVTKPVTRPRMQTVKISREAVLVVDGVATLTIVSDDVLQPAFTEVPLFDADGAPVLDAGGQRRMHREPVMETVDVACAGDVPDLDASGAQKWVLGLRYAELAQFVMAGLAARIAALEAH